MGSSKMLNAAVFSNVGLVKSDSIIGVPWFVIYPFEDFGGINTSTLETEVSEE